MIDVTRIIAYEQGELDQEATVDLFQELVNSGAAWRLQGHYGRTAVALIEAGLVHQPSPDDDNDPPGGDEMNRVNIFGVSRIDEDYQNMNR